MENGGGRTENSMEIGRHVHGLFSRIRERDGVREYRKGLWRVGRFFFFFSNHS